MPNSTQNKDTAAKQVLLVEDELLLRTLLHRLLERWGYRTLTAQNGREALEMGYWGSMDRKTGLMQQDLCRKLVSDCAVKIAKENCCPQKRGIWSRHIDGVAERGSKQ